MLQLIDLATDLHVMTGVDSKLATTREFWRRKFGMPEEIVNDPRPLAEIILEMNGLETPA